MLTIQDENLGWLRRGGALYAVLRMAEVRLEAESLSHNWFP